MIVKNTYKDIQSSGSIKGSFILLGCSWLYDTTSFFIFSADKSWLHRSRLIFIKASEPNLDSDMVARRITQSPSSISSSLSESSVSLGTSVGGDESAVPTIASCDSEPTIEVVFIYKFCCLFI